MDRIDRNLVEGEVDALAADGNPVGYWKLWQRCREADLPIPTEVLAYLDRVAKWLLAFAATPPKRIGPALQKALEFQDGSGRGSDFSRYRETNRDIDLVVDALTAFGTEDGVGKQPSQNGVFAQVGQARGVSEETVKRAWRRYCKTERS
jgi:hypothetical protein